jgi:hypothetical protein
MPLSTEALLPGHHPETAISAPPRGMLVRRPESQL